jgi:hypothetical protein
MSKARSLDLCALGLFLLSGAIVATAGVFVEAPQYATGPDPFCVAVGDFNGDGNADLVLTSAELAGSVSVLLGNGHGFFRPPHDFATGSFPLSVAVGDFNGDSKQDLAVANTGTGTGITVSVLLGQGNGTFQPRMDFETAIGPFVVATADFNGDGILDLATTNGNAVSILLGDGSGAFPTHNEYATSSAYYGFQVAVGDFNRDGKIDLATVGGVGVNILLGNGDGTFQAHVDYAVANYPTALAIGDFNGDGNPDLAVTSYDPYAPSGTVSVLLGKGDGTFRTYVDFAVGTTPERIEVADLNGDGKPDLALVNHGGNSVSVLLGKGDGTFPKRADFGAGGYPQAIAIADFNGDGKLDLVAANGKSLANQMGLSATVSLLINNGNGGFQARPDFVTGIDPQSVVVGDFNQDSKLDLVTANFKDNSLSVLLGNGSGRFQTQKSFCNGKRSRKSCSGRFQR